MFGHNVFDVRIVSVLSYTRCIDVSLVISVLFLNVYAPTLPAIIINEFSNSGFDKINYKVDMTSL